MADTWLGVKTRLFFTIAVSIRGPNSNELVQSFDLRQLATTQYQFRDEPHLLLSHSNALESNSRNSLFHELAGIQFIADTTFLTSFQHSIHHRKTSITARL
jgi:hypothetical protein